MPSVLKVLVGVISLTAVYLTLQHQMSLHFYDCASSVRSFRKFCDSLTDGVSGASNERLDAALRHVCKDPLVVENLSCFGSSHSASKIVLKYVCSENSSRIGLEDAWSCGNFTPTGVPFVIKSGNLDIDSVTDMLQQEDFTTGEQAFDMAEWINDLTYTTLINYGQPVCGSDLAKCREMYRQEVAHVESFTDRRAMAKEAELILHTVELLPEVVWSRIAPDLFPRVVSTSFPWYMVEYAHPLDAVPTDANVAVRLDIAKDLINFFGYTREYAMESFGDELLVCDLKLEHFGWTNLQNDRKPLSKQMKILDADTVFLRAHLTTATAPPGSRKCYFDSDCDFFDCKNILVCRHSRCVDPGGPSREKRERAVIRALCEKVILPLSLNGWQKYAMKAHTLVFGDGPRRLLTDLDYQAIKTLLPACGIHHSASDRDEL